MKQNLDGLSRSRLLHFIPSLLSFSIPSGIYPTNLPVPNLITSSSFLQLSPMSDIPLVHLPSIFPLLSVIAIPSAACLTSQWAILPTTDFPASFLLPSLQPPIPASPTISLAMGLTLLLFTALPSQQMTSLAFWPLLPHPFCLEENSPVSFCPKGLKHPNLV